MANYSNKALLRAGIQMVILVVAVFLLSSYITDRELKKEENQDITEKEAVVEETVDKSSKKTANSKKRTARNGAEQKSKKDKAEKHSNEALVDFEPEEPPQTEMAEIESSSLEDDVVSTTIERNTDPQFPGGEAVMQQWISENLKYPEKAKAQGISGQVIVQFEVSNKGDIKKVKVVEGVSKDLDKEAVRLVKKMPKWIPATMDGKNVKSTYSLCITFKLDD